MSEQFPTGHTPDNSPNFDDSVDIIGEAIREGAVIARYHEAADHSDMLTYGNSISERLRELSEEKRTLLTIQTTYAWICLGTEITEPETVTGSFAIEGVLEGFWVVDSNDGTVRLGISLSRITTPEFKYPPGISSDDLKLIVPTTDIEAYSYLSESL